MLISKRRIGKIFLVALIVLLAMKYWKPSLVLITNSYRVASDSEFDSTPLSNYQELHPVLVNDVGSPLGHEQVFHQNDNISSRPLGDYQEDHPILKTDDMKSPHGNYQEGHPILKNDKMKSPNGNYQFHPIPVPVNDTDNLLSNDQNSFGFQAPRADYLKDKRENVPRTLPSQVIDGIRKFVFFLGSGRSGSSILGSLMDAHPHVVIAHQMLNRGFEVFSSKTELFNALYSKSVSDASGSRASTGKGYSLGVESLWQGKYDRYIEVIGDKCGGRIITSYSENRERFIDNYRQLEKRLSVPIRFIKPIRNPFDMVASLALAKTHKYGATKAKNVTIQVNKQLIHTTLNFFDGGEELIGVFGRENVLDVHNCDLVDDPRGSISRIFKFLEVEISEHYLDVCSAKVFKSVSRSRNLILWTPEQIEMIERRMKKYSVLSRYSFTSD